MCARKNDHKVCKLSLRPHSQDPRCPAVSIVEISLCAPRPARSSEGLIVVKFQRLQGAALVEVEPRVVSEVTNIVVDAERSPIKFVGAGVIAR